MLDKILNILLDIFFNDCLICKEESNMHNDLCNTCFATLKSYGKCFICPENEICRCGIHTFVPFLYDKNIKQLVLQLKYCDKFYLSDFFARMIIKNTKITDFIDENTVLVPIPISKSRLIKRGYNQSVLLCKSLEKILKIPIAYFTLKKTSETIQKEKDKKIRYLNAQSIDIDNIIPILGKKVCIVDDIIASGNTIMRCHYLLKQYTEDIFITAIAKT